MEPGVFYCVVGSDIHQVCLSLNPQRVLFFFFLKERIEPPLRLVRLQIKADSEGDSSAGGPPLGNGRDRPMKAFVRGKEWATMVKETDRERGNKQEKEGSGGAH